MKKRIWILVILIVVGVFGGRAWYLHKEAEQNKDAIKIGLILPLTGMPAKDGKEALLAAQMAEQEVNSYNKTKIKVVPEDGKFTAKDTISAFNKLRGENVSAALVYGDMPTLSVIPLLNEKGFPLMTVSGSKNITTSSPWTFRMFLPAFERSNAIVNFIKKQDIKNIAILYVKEPIGEEVITSFRNSLGQTGIRVLDEETFRPTDLDTKAQIIKLLDKNPDALFIFGWNPGYVNALNYLKDLRYKGIVITDLNIVPNINLLVNKGEGIYYADLNPKADGFRQVFKKKYGNFPNPHTIFTYESVKLFSQLINQVGTNPEFLQKALLDLDSFNSDFGKISFDKDGEIEHLNVVIKQMQSDGTAKVVKE